MPFLGLFNSGIADFEMTIELTLKLLRMAALTKTELDVAVPHSFFAKHMYWPEWGKNLIDER